MGSQSWTQLSNSHTHTHTQMENTLVVAKSYGGGGWGKSRGKGELTVKRQHKGETVLYFDCGGLARVWTCDKFA